MQGRAPVASGQRRPPNIQSWTSVVAEARQPVAEQRVERSPGRRLHRQRNPRGCVVVEVMQCPVDDQAVAKFLFDFGEWRWTPIPHLVWCRVCEDEESRLVRSACELPHGPLEQVAEAPDAVLLVRTCSVVWFVV